MGALDNSRLQIKLIVKHVVLIYEEDNQWLTLC
jgi:hypothetical protein